MENIIVGVGTLKARVLDSIYERMDTGEFNNHESDIYFILFEYQKIFEILKEFECDEE